jgi:DNA-binding transcriptional LysR family regulator
MDKLGYMRTLVTVAKLGSFSLAAKEFNVTPGMMSKQVKQLEDNLGVRLLNRTTRGVSLTHAGEIYIEKAVSILQSIEDVEGAVNELSTGTKGILRISCPPSFGRTVLTPIISSFVLENHELRIELGLQNDEPNVIASRLDLIFRLGRMRDSSLVGKQVATAPFVVCASPRYTEQAGIPKRLEDLAAHNCVVDGSMHEEADSWEFLNNQRVVISQVVRGNFFSFNTGAVVEAVIQGLGIAYVPRYAVVDELSTKKLVEINFPDCKPKVEPLYALYASREHIAVKIRDFVSYFITNVGAESGMLGVIVPSL